MKDWKSFTFNFDGLHGKPYLFYQGDMYLKEVVYKIRCSYSDKIDAFKHGRRIESYYPTRHGYFLITVKGFNVPYILDCLKGDYTISEV